MFSVCSLGVEAVLYVIKWVLTGCEVGWPVTELLHVIVLCN